MIPENLKYEYDLWNKGIKRVGGFDEVGRGCLAGPIVTAGVVWNQTVIETILDESGERSKLLLSIKDSKKLSKKLREKLTPFILENSESHSLILIDSKKIDQKGIGVCNIAGLEKAVISIKGIEHALVDHHEIFRDTDQIPSTSITNGESFSLSIASASIIAKVYRDKLVTEKYHEMYPDYGFITNMGYGTKTHIEAIKKLGLTPIHRRSFCRNIEIPS